MTDLLVSSPEEFRAVVSSHLFRNLDTIRGYLVDSQNTFLRQRLGQPLIKAMLQHYTDIKPIVPDPSEVDTDNYEALEADPWAKLIQLSQRCISYDALYRSAGIRRVSDNDMGINVAESDNFASVDKDRFAEYKIDLYKGAHSASDMLLTQLQDWEALLPPQKAPLSSPQGGMTSDGTQPAPVPNEPATVAEGSAPVPEASPEGSSPVPNESATVPEASPEGSPSTAIAEIIDLWRQSPTYPLTDGLLFTTATEFNTYVNIQQSLDKFIELLPDIRYCQELHLESEIGIDLLAYLHNGHRSGTLNAVEQRAYRMLQRTLSLNVEARSKMFNRADAKDEASGHMRITLSFLRTNQTQFQDKTPWLTSPLFLHHLWPSKTTDGISQDDSHLISPSNSADAYVPACGQTAHAANIKSCGCQSLDTPGFLSITMI